MVPHHKNPSQMVQFPSILSRAQSTSLQTVQHQPYLGGYPPFRHIKMHISYIKNTFTACCCCCCLRCTAKSYSVKKPIKHKLYKYMQEPGEKRSHINWSTAHKNYTTLFFLLKNSFHVVIKFCLFYQSQMVVLRIWHELRVFCLPQSPESNAGLWKQNGKGGKNCTFLSLMTKAIGSGWCYVTQKCTTSTLLVDHFSFYTWLAKKNIRP